MRPMYVNGQWVEASDGANEETFGPCIPIMGLFGISRAKSHIL